MKSRLFLGISLSASLLSACASNWKLHGGPTECIQMCKTWDLEFTAMVGVGSQDRMGPGATACVCQPKGKEHSAAIDAAGTSTTSLAAPITAAEMAAAQAAYMMQQQQYSTTMNNHTGYRY